MSTRSDRRETHRGSTRRDVLALATAVLPINLVRAQTERSSATDAKPLGFPLSISRRPFAVEPMTGVMMPDGIFDCAIFFQEITCFIKNTSRGTIRDLWVRTYPENNPDWKLVGPWQINLGDLKSGAASQVAWLSDFSASTPGKKLFRIEVGGTYENGQGFDGYISSTLFVSRTSYDSATRKYSCEVPEGVMELVFSSSEQSSPYEVVNSDGPTKVQTMPVPWKFSATVRAKAGHELEIPFNDPWWKVVAWIIAVVAAIGALLEAKKGNGYAMIGTSGHGHDNPSDYHWCFPDPVAAKPEDMTPAGMLSVIANAAIAIGLSDKIDPWERGRVASGFSLGEVPKEEVLSLLLTLPSRLVGGAAYKVGANWSYSAVSSTGKTTKLSMSDMEPNSHVVKKWDIDSPGVTNFNKPIFVRIRGHLSDGSLYFGEDLYAFAVFTTPGSSPRTIRIPLVDDGRGFDINKNDGWYSCGFIIENLFSQYGVFEYRGEWTVTFFAQNVNSAHPAMPPKVAATYIGGNPVLSSVQLVRLSETPVTDKSCPIDFVRKFLVN